MKAIIMAGGEGTRLKSVTGDTPKPMALLAGRPVLEHILKLLKKNGIRQVCMALHYRPEVIQDYFGDGSSLDMEVSYQVEQAQLGTAGGVRACRGFYQNEDFLVISGDCACDFDLRALIEQHRRRAPAVTMALAAHETPLQYGTVLTDRSGFVVSFVEKPSWEQVVTDLVNTGIYILTPGAMDFVPEGQAWDFARDLFPALMEAKMEILGVRMEGYWCDIGTPRSYYQCNLDALDGTLHLEQPPAPAPSRPTVPRRPPDGMTVTEYRCRSRARLMRELSQQLMEAGEDFDLRDGVRLHLGLGDVRIAPSPERESLVISADAEDPGRASALVRGCARFLQGIEGTDSGAPGA